MLENDKGVPKDSMSGDNLGEVVSGEEGSFSLSRVSGLGVVRSGKRP